MVNSQEDNKMLQLIDTQREASRIPHIQKLT